MQKYTLKDLVMEIIDDDTLSNMDILVEKIDKNMVLDEAFGQYKDAKVSGNGNLDSDIVFISGVGLDSDVALLFNKIINAISLTNENIYLDIVDEFGELEKKFLAVQLNIIRPKVVCLLGNIAIEILNIDDDLKNIRGKEFLFCDIKTIPTYHPQELIDDASKKKDVWEDMKKIRDVLI